MIRKPSRAEAREKRHLRIRNKVSGTAQKPRLAVFRSNKHIYAQIIDDTVGGEDAMIRKPSRAEARVKRHLRIRNKINGTAQKPRLAVFRSNKHIYAQIIDDTIGNTIVSASTMEAVVKDRLSKTSDIEAAKVVGTEVAKKAIAK